MRPDRQDALIIHCKGVVGCTQFKIVPLVHMSGTMKKHGYGRISDFIEDFVCGPCQDTYRDLAELTGGEA